MSKSTIVDALQRAETFMEGFEDDNQQANIADDLSAIRNAISTISAQTQDASSWEPPQDCERKEELGFEAWASSQHYDMHEHPLHYLFMDPRTDAARQGWKAALQYVRDDFAAERAKLESRHDLDPLDIHLQKLIGDNPTKARLAQSREDMRMWFVAQLTSVASHASPLTEIEAMVSRQLAAVKGGEA